MTISCTTRSPSVAVCLVSLPERHRLLAEATESVYNQTLQPDHLLIGVDYAGVGEVANMNRLIDAAGPVDFLAFLHDDDIWLPNHLEAAMQHADTADVIVADFDLVGRPQHTIERKHGNFADLAFTNWFWPSAVVARRSTWGHWTEPDRPPPHDWVDWSNFRRLLTAGARFVHTNTLTCQYRFFGDNGSWSA